MRNSAVMAAFENPDVAVDVDVAVMAADVVVAVVVVAGVGIRFGWTGLYGRPSVSLISHKDS